MHRIGTVLQYDSKGNLVAELDGMLPKLGAIALDDTGARVGRVSDVIGNVKRPYIVVKTTRTDKISALYMGESEKTGGKISKEVRKSAGGTREK